MFLEIERNEIVWNHNYSLHRQRNCNNETIQIDTVYKELGISTKKKPEIEEEVIEDLTS